MKKKKITTILIVIATIALAGVAVFTAIRLYQLRQEPVAPTAPTSQPAAAAPVSCNALAFTLTTSEEPACYEACTETPDNCPSGLVCQTIGDELLCVNPDFPYKEDCIDIPTYDCDSACTTDAQCQGVDENYICYATTNTCRHQDFPEEEDCTEGATATPTATPTSTATATATATATSSSTAEPELPDAGVAYPTIIGGAAGILLILISLALAL